MRPRPPDQALVGRGWRYGLAVAGVALAFILRLALDPVLQERAPFLLFVLPVLVAACIGGIGPGLLAIVLSLAAGTWAFVAPEGSLVVASAGDLATAALFAVTACAVVWLAARLATVRRRADLGEFAAALSEERFRLLVEGVNEFAIYMLDQEGRIASWNGGAERLTGWRAGEVLGRPISILFSPEACSQGKPEQELRGAREDGQFRTEIRRCRRDGTEFWADITLTALLDEEGRLRGFANVTQDITARKRAEADLSASEALKGVVLDSALDGIVTITEESRVVEWNTAAEDIFGYARSAVLGRSISELIIPYEYQQKHHEGLAHFLATGEGPVLGRRIEVEAVRADGSRFPIELAITPTRVRDKLHFTAHMRDITDRKRAEERQHLLMSELDHRVKNTLARVQSIAAQTLRNTVSPEAFYEAFEARLQALSRAHNLLNEARWSGAALRSLLWDELAPHQDSAEQRCLIEGPHVSLSACATLSLGLVFHELTTNAAKYGALSVPNGWVEVRWHVSVRAAITYLDLEWRELGGSAVDKPGVPGFGFRLIQLSITHELGGEVQIDLVPAGLRCTMSVPLGPPQS